MENLKVNENQVNDLIMSDRLRANEKNNNFEGDRRWWTPHPSAND